jgi:hypothetical protein
MGLGNVKKSSAALVVPILASLAGLAGGCSEDFTRSNEPTSPVLSAGADVSPPTRGFYPLAVGNSWTYERKHTVEFEVIEGPPYHEVRDFEGIYERRIVGIEAIDGIEYEVEQATLTASDRTDTVRTWAGLRQDHAGLYGAGITITEPADLPAPDDENRRSVPRETPAETPPAPMGTAADPFSRMLTAPGPGGFLPEPVPPILVKAWRQHARRLDAILRSLEPGIAQGPSTVGRRGGVLADEVQYLRYPLHPKATWSNREEPFFVRSEVEAHEVLDLPAGRFPSYRVRVVNERHDPEDRIRVWYGPCGRLAVSIHMETWAMDVETGEIARISVDQTDRLSGLSLVDPCGCGKKGPGGSP